MENLKLLLDYQQADLELTNYETQAKDTPTRKKLMQIQRFMKNAQEKLAEMETATKVKNGTVNELGGQYLKLVEDMEDLGKDISYYSECNDEELDEKEIRSITAAAERINDEMNKIKKTLTALKTQIDQDSKLAMQLLQKMKSAKAEYDTLKVEYNKEVESNSKDIREYRAKVEEIEKQIDPKYIAEYKRIKGFRTNPIAVFKDSRCGGCMMQLPSSTTGKILGASMPFVCENCGRILIIE
ncbi:MAG: hypothetical protein IKK29_06595 [Christensenellaceae bacterium]|nr:hypothetical protein [Christensenellaceae bacterium]